MQAVGANQVQQDAHERFGNLPSAGVSPNVRVKAFRVGYHVVVLCGVLPTIGATFLAQNVVRGLVEECCDSKSACLSKSESACLLGAGLMVLGIVVNTSMTIAERVCARPGGFIFERVCTILDAHERQAAEVDTPVRPERYLR